MKLKFYHRELYGKHFWYPACNDADLICDLAGRKTLDSHHINILKKLRCILSLDYQPLYSIDENFNITKKKKD